MLTRTPFKPKATWKRLERRPFRHKTKRHTIPSASREAVYSRSLGNCEAPIHAENCEGRGQHVHHRRLLSQGGSDHPNNLMHLSTACHDHYHSHPLMAMCVGVIVPGYVRIIEEAS